MPHVNYRRDIPKPPKVPASLRKIEARRTDAARDAIAEAEKSRRHVETMRTQRDIGARFMWAARRVLPDVQWREILAAAEADRAQYPAQPYADE